MSDAHYDDVHNDDARQNTTAEVLPVARVSARRKKVDEIGTHVLMARFHGQRTNILSMISCPIT